MGYQIEACLEGGVPSLKIYDYPKQQLHLHWRFTGPLGDTSSRQQVHQLFRELLLLTCRQDLQSPRVFQLRPLAGKQALMGAQLAKPAV